MHATFSLLSHMYGWPKRKSLRDIFYFFKKNFWRTSVHWYTCLDFWWYTPRFKGRGGFLTCVLPHLQAMDSPTKTADLLMASMAAKSFFIRILVHNTSIGGTWTRLKKELSPRLPLQENLEQYEFRNKAFCHANAMTLFYLQPKNRIFFKKMTVDLSE